MAIEQIWDGTTDDLISDLIGEFAAPDPVIEVNVGGRILTFKALVDQAEFNRLKREGRNFCKLKASPHGKPEWFDTDDETKGFAYLLADASIKPKLDAVSLLRLAKEACMGFMQIKDGYFLGLVSKRAAVEKTEIDERKNESSGISDGEIVSPCPATSGVSTRTSSTGRHLRGT